MLAEIISRYDAFFSGSLKWHILRTQKSDALNCPLELFVMCIKALLDQKQETS
jgi:hypothetical protein